MSYLNDANILLGSGVEMQLSMSALPDGSADLWCTLLDLRLRQLHYLVSILSEDEQTRARLFYYDRERCRFIAARGMIHLILAQYLECRPEQVRIRYNAGGRPVVDTGRAHDPLHFSISHTAGLAVFAVSRHCRVGIDVEQLRQVLDADDIVRDCFSTREQAAWRALPKEQRRDAFIHAWTRKEAVLKAMGVGLAYPVARVEVTFSPGEPAELLSTGDDTQQQSNWSLVELFPAQGYAGAVAVEKMSHKRRYP